MTERRLFGEFNTAFATVGAIVSVYIGAKLIIFVLKCIKMFGLSMGTNPKKYGDWAVITGATDGIGKAYVEQLALKGLNVVLISRTESKLKDLAAEISSKYNVETKIISVDFSGGIEIYDDISKQLTGLDIGVLVNNVGMSYSFPRYFHELPDVNKLLPSLINVNCLAVTMMTQLVLSGMLSSKKGLIINISSAAGACPAPLLAVYSATKAFTDYFSRCLSAEYAAKGIVVQSVLPFFVATKLSKIRKSSVTVPTPASYVKSALNTLGTEDRTFGCFSHKLQGALSSILPEVIMNYIQMSMGLGLRKRNLLKLKEKAK